MKIYGEQWEDSLRDKHYPFDTPNAPVADGTVLPANFVLDAALFMESADSIAFLDTLVVAADRTITLSFTDGTNPVGTATLAPGASGRIEILQSGVGVGFLEIDADHAEIVRGWFPRDYLFVTPLLPHVVVVSDPVWRPGLVLPDGTVLTGEVYLAGVDGIQLEIVAGGFKVHAYGDPYAGRSGPVRTVLSFNGVLPDSEGNIQLIAEGTGGVGGDDFRLNFAPEGNGRIRVELQG